jgi:hypothetical protein
VAALLLGERQQEQQLDRAGLVLEAVARLFRSALEVLDAVARIAAQAARLAGRRGLGVERGERLERALRTPDLDVAAGVSRIRATITASRPGPSMPAYGSSSLAW